LVFNTILHDWDSDVNREFLEIFATKNLKIYLPNPLPHPRLGGGLGEVGGGGWRWVRERDPPSPTHDYVVWGGVRDPPHGCYVVGHLVPLKKIFGSHGAR